MTRRERRVDLAEHLAAVSPSSGESKDVVRLIATVGRAAAVLQRHLRRAAIDGHLGYSGGRNSTGDSQKKLDLLGNETVVEAFARTGLVAAIVSEELEQPKVLSRKRTARYVVCADPLDGSSNTDINGPVGTIFGIYRSGSILPEPLHVAQLELLAGGYVLYGPSTVLVYATEAEVTGFTFDAQRGSFVLTHPKLRCPTQGAYYSANLGNSDCWPTNVRKFVEYLAASNCERPSSTHHPYSLRYSGALVADVHRSILEGGLYFYPPDDKHPEGKLRLLYECKPLAFVAERAGGRASTGTQPVLTVAPDSVHQRIPLAIGSKAEVELYEQFVAQGGHS